MPTSESRYERLDAIERRLARDPHGRTTGEFARELGVSPDTIRRDLALLDSRGTGLTQDGRRYQLDHRHEMLVLYLAARLVSRHSDEHNPHVASALDKLVSPWKPSARVGALKARRPRTPGSERKGTAMSQPNSAPTTNSRGLVVQADEGNSISGRNGGYVVTTKVTDEDTRGAYALQHMTVAPNFPWIPTHIHHQEDEAFYVLDGECSVRIGEETHTLGPGAFALMPRDVAHTFANFGTVPAHVIVISSPGNVVHYFEEAAALTNASPDGRPDMAQLVALAARYGIEFVPTR